MTPNFKVSLLFLMFVLGSAFGQEQTSRGNVSPTGDEWTEERVDALLAERENGRPLHVMKGEIDFHTRLYNKHVKDNNCAGILKLYDPNLMVIDQDGTVTKGLEAIQLILGALQGVATLNMTSLAVTPLGKDGRFIFQHGHADARDSNGNPLYTGGGFLIWKRHGNNKLRIAIEIYDKAALIMHGTP